MRNANGDRIGTFNFRTAPLGAGGFVTGLDISSDGTLMVHNTDVHGGYIRSSTDTQWQQLIRADRLAQAEYDPRPDNSAILTARSGPGHGNPTATFQTRIAPSDKNIIYMGWNGFIYRSANAGATFTRTAMPAKALLPQLGQNRRFNRCIDVHPTLPNTVIYGTNGDGVYFTTDGFATHTEINVPATEFINTNLGVGKYLVAFDPSNPNTIYIHVNGTGLYRSTTGLGANSFTLVSGGPTHCSNLIVTPAGVVYLCQFRNGGSAPATGLWRLNGATWTAIADTPGVDQVAVNPFNANHIAAMDEGGGLFQSFNAGATWLRWDIPRGNWTRGDGEVKWLSNQKKGMFPAHIMFDPVVPNKLWVAEGIGVAWCDLPSTTVEDSVWHDFSAGNEELVPCMGLSRPGIEPVILTCMDKATWRMEDTFRPTNNFANTEALDGNGNLVKSIGVAHCRGIDYAIDDPENFIVATMNQGTVTGYSTNGGRSFSRFRPIQDPPVLPSQLFGGSVAVGNKNNIIVCPGNNQPAYYTKDFNPATGVGTWLPLSIGGYSPSDNFINNALGTQRTVITSDKTRPGVFALIHNNIIPNVTPSTLGRDVAGMWITTDGGDNWTRVFTGVINTVPPVPSGTTSQFWQADLTYIPGFTGELLYASCEGNAGDVLLWSQNDGASWSRLGATMGTIRAFGLGKAAPGQTRPAVYVSATVGGVQGLWVSFDWFATAPIFITRWPNGILNSINRGGAVVGDMNRFGRCYVGVAGAGWVVCDYGKRFALT